MLPKTLGPHSELPNLSTHGEAEAGSREQKPTECSYSLWWIALAVVPVGSELKPYNSEETQMRTIFFDIETGPLPEAELATLLPAFDPNEVKMGNLKDPEKIAAKLSQAEEAHRLNSLKRAALDALTGRVLAIGLLFDNDDFSVLCQEDEAELLRQFWSVCCGECRMVGFNSNSFDLPFLIRRS